MDYLIGSKKEFLDFVDSIKAEDKIGILTHTDLDGLASAVFLEKILEAKGHEVTFLDFLFYEDGVLEKVISNLKENSIDKIFISDFSIESLDDVAFNLLKEEFDVFLIDHHPLVGGFDYGNKVIKTASSDCSALTIFDLGKEIFDSENWEWLVCAAIFSDYSYKNPVNFEFMKSVYPDLTLENISYSKPGIIAKKVSSALIYYKRDLKKVYDLVLEKNLSELDEIHEIIDEEINKCVEEYFDKAEFYPEKNMFIYEVDSKFSIASYVTTMVSTMKKDFTFISYQGGGEYYKISARNQNVTQDMNKLMKKGVEGLEHASGGGHAPASAARIMREDLGKFKGNILK